MIHFPCPSCKKKLAVSDDKAGKAGVCPACKTRFEIPGLETTSREIADPRIQSQPDPRKSQMPTAVDAPPIDDESDVERVRRKRRKRRRRSDGSSSLVMGLDWFWLSLIALIVVALPILGLGAFWRPAAVIAAVIGTVATVTGGIWILVIAFMDDVTQGLLCLCVPCYNLYYIFANLEETKRAAALWGAGVVINILARIMLSAAP